MPNIPENVNNVLQEFITKVQEILGEHLKKVILYGSYARGDYNESSDLDIMILTDLDDKELDDKQFEIWGISYDIESDHDFNIDLSSILVNMQRYSKRINFIPFYKNVEKEGVELVNG